MLVKPSESKLLGLKWDKFEDTIAVQFPSTSSAPTKREVLAKLAKVYDPLRLASPITLQGKQIYHEACNCKVSWDKAIPENQKICWQRWEQSLLAEITTRRPLAPYQQPVVSAALHVLGNVNLWGRSGVFNCTPRRWNHSNPGCSESKISQERTNSPQVGVLSVPTWLPI